MKTAEIRDQLLEHMAGEPDCTCSALDSDFYNACGCEYHDPQSAWNRELARLEAVLERLQDREFIPAREDIDYEYAKDMGDVA